MERGEGGGFLNAFVRGHLTHQLPILAGILTRPSSERSTVATTRLHVHLNPTGPFQGRWRHGLDDDGNPLLGGRAGTPATGPRPSTAIGWNARARHCLPQMVLNSHDSRATGTICRNFPARRSKDVAQQGSNSPMARILRERVESTYSHERLVKNLQRSCRNLWREQRGSGAEFDVPINCESYGRVRVGVGVIEKHHVVIPSVR